MPSTNNAYGIDPAGFGLDEARAKAVAALDQDQIAFAHALFRRAENAAAAERHCAVFLADKTDLQAQVGPDDYNAIAARFEADHDDDLPDAGQMSEKAVTYLTEKFGNVF